jgi:hypothetical protein
VPAANASNGQPRNDALLRSERRCHFDSHGVMGLRQRLRVLGGARRAVQRTRVMPEVPWHVPISADPAVVGRISMLSHSGRVAVPLRVTNSRGRVRIMALRVRIVFKGTNSRAKGTNDRHGDVGMVARGTRQWQIPDYL